MNVKKTKKFKENRPENYHVHDSVTVKLEIRGNPIDITIPSDHFPLMVTIPIFRLVQRLDFTNTSIVRRVAALTPRLTLS